MQKLLIFGFLISILFPIYQNCSMMKSNDCIFLEGIPVEYNVFPRESPVISHAEFYLKSNCSENKEFNIDKLFLLKNGEKEEIKEYYIYMDQSKSSKKIVITPKNDLYFRVTFPFISVDKNSRNSFQVLLFGFLDGKEIKATSKITFTFENRK